MAIVDLDWVGPIMPTCTITGVVYILLMIDYFSRFLWAKGYTKHTAQEVVDLHENHVFLIFGHPRAVYTDNGSHLVNELVRDYYRNCEITHYTGPISHASSTGLLERAVQGLVTFLRTNCIECKTTDAWSLHIREGVLFANTKDAKIHGYALAEIILGFTPQLIHFDISAAPIPDRLEAEIKEAPYHQQQIFMALRDEKKCLASEAAAYTNYLKRMRGRRQKIPNPGDLVLVRNHVVDSQRGRKLEAKWLGPRLLVSYSTSKLTGYVREIYGDGKAKKYHLNDILLYQERRALLVDGVRLLAKPEGTVPTVIGGKGIGEFAPYDR